MQNVRLFAATAALALSAPCLANAVVEKNDRVEIDYSTQKIHYFGESVVKQEDGDAALKAAERRARTEGLDYLQANAAKVLPFKPSELRDNTTSYVTNYYGDGTVRVYLETSLPEVAPKDIGFAQKDLADASSLPASGVVFSVDKKAKPAPTYQIVDESGAVLFEARDMAEAAFRQNLMGKWLQKPAEKDLAAAVGPKPAKLALTSVGPGKFQVSRAAWDELVKDSRPLLINGRVALVVP